MCLVPDIRVSISNEPENMEAECQEPCPKQVTQCCQIRYRKVVRVHASVPHPVDHPVSNVEKDKNLEDRSPIVTLATGLGIRADLIVIT